MKKYFKEWIKQEDHAAIEEDHFLIMIVISKMIHSKHMSTLNFEFTDTIY